MKNCSNCKHNQGPDETGACVMPDAPLCYPPELALWEPIEGFASPKMAPKNNIHEGKPRPSLLPMDILMKYLCEAYEEGVIKYERESWRDGFSVSVMVDAALRHIIAFFWGCQDVDIQSETKKHHLSGAIFSLICILHTLDTRPDLDDRHARD